jgi:MinD superfamily P-loop ATPase
MELDEARCKHCGKCIRVCPYGARYWDQNQKMQVDEAVCRKCALCVSICDSLTITE